MDIINQIIHSLKKEEIRHFKLFANRSHNTQNRKDLALFDYIKKHKNSYNEDKIHHQLYGNAPKNAFYRLKHRLLSELNKSLWLLHFEKSAVSQSLYLYTLSHLHFEHKRFEIALFYLRKAEKTALKEEHFEVLDLIYSLFIRLSYEIVSINPEEYIALKRENREKRDALNDLDDILAVVIYRLKSSLNSSKDIEILRLLQKTVDEYTQRDTLVKSPKLRFKIYAAVSRILAQNHEYVTLEAYLKQTYEAFSADDLFNKTNHRIKLQMLTYLVNALFKNRKFRESLQYAEVLKEAMQEYNGMLEEQFRPFYYYALVNNYSEFNVEKAILILQELKQQLASKASFDSISIYINLSILQYRIKKYRKSIKSLIELYLFEPYQKANQELKLKVELFELSVRYKALDNEILIQRIQQVFRDYEGLFQDPKHQRDAQFLSLLKRMNEASFELEPATQLLEDMQGFLHTQASASAPSSIFDYNTIIQEQLNEWQ